MANTVAAGPAGMAGLALAPPNRIMALAMMEAAEAQRDLAGAVLLPFNERMGAKLVLVAMAMEKAAGRIRRELLGQVPEPPEPPMPAPQAPVTASEAEQEREIERLRGWLDHIGEQAGATFIETMVHQALDTDALAECGLNPRPVPGEPVVTPDMMAAADNALEQQYRASPWEEAKDVLEGLDWRPILEAALRQQPKTIPTPYKEQTP